jgi:hypothetical protein
VRWLDPEGLEVKANPLIRFVLRPEILNCSEVGGIPRLCGAENAARGYLDDAVVVDIAAALCCQVRNDPGKSNLALLFFFLFWAFPDDENLASSPPSPQPRLIFGRHEKPPVNPLRPGASSILVSTESAHSDKLN